MLRPRLTDVVFVFHAGDQDSAARLLDVLLAASEGTECRYHLRYGDPLSTLRIGATLDRFIAKRNATLSAEAPGIDADPALMADAPEVDTGPGLRTVRTHDEKRKILQWNRVVFESIETYDAFLLLEPDCVVLKDSWLSCIADAWSESPTPIFGHLKRGRIDGRDVPTHWAGCSVYDGSVLRSLPLARTFRERFPNPWWRYRDRPDTQNANNAFWGPEVSAWDLSFDYLLFLLYWREQSGHDNAVDWPVDPGLDRSDLIRCEHRTKTSAEAILERHWGVLPLFHGAKDDQVRIAATTRFEGLLPSTRTRFPVGRGREGASTQAPVSLGALRDRYRSRRCFIIGNGPSLNLTDLTRLSGEFTIGLNRIYLNYDRMGFEPSFYCAVNPYVLDQFAADIDALRSIKFVNERARAWLRGRTDTFFMQSVPRVGFAEDLEAGAWHEGWTVTYCALQVAFHLGFDDVILVGVDHHFERAGKPDQLVTESQPDVNHFHPDYFGQGVRWQYPNLERSEQSYRLARSVYARAHRRLRDATIGGRLTIFEKVDYETLFPKEPDNRFTSPVVSIVMPVKNGAATIGEAIRSVQAQDLEAWELLIVDDDSNDGTVAVVNECARLDPRVHYSRSEGSGVSMARNQGLERARGEFMTFLDSDDLYYDWALSARVEALRGRPDLLAVHCRAELVDERGQPLGWQVGASRITFKDAWRNPFHLGALMGRAEFLKQFRFDSASQPAEDYLFATQILRAGAELERVESCRVAYRLRADSTVARDPQALDDAVSRVLDRVYADDPACPIPMAAYHDGLRAPDRLRVEQRRRAALLITQVLAGRAAEAAELVSQLSGCVLDATEIEIDLRRAVARHFRCPLRHAWRAFRDRGDTALDLARSLGLFEAVPTLHQIVAAAIQTAEPQGVVIVAGPMARETGSHIAEPGVIYDLLSSTPASDAVMVDVGAHRGESLERFARAGWMVHAFEPDSTNREALVGRFGSFPRVCVDPRAVSSVVRTAVPFWVSGESTGVSTLSPFTDAHRPKERVDTTTLSALVGEKAIRSVDFLKVDVEGHELMVLEGFPWDRFRPRVIVCEFEDRKTALRGFDYFGLGDFLVAKGYQVLTSEWHPIIRYGVRHDWRQIAEYPCELADPQSWGNLLAFRDSEDLDKFRAIVSRSISGVASSDSPAASKRERVLAMTQASPESSPVAVSQAPDKGHGGLSRLRSELAAWGGISTLASAGLALAALASHRYAAPLLAASFLIFLAREVVRARRFDALLRAREDLAVDLRRRVADLTTWSKRLEARSPGTRVDRIALELAQLATETRGELRRHGARIRAMGGVNAALFRHHERELSGAALDRIRTIWLPRLGLDLSSQAVGYMAHRIGVIEDRCQGRLAATMETEVLRCLVARAVRGRSLDLLEIGTLFGIHAACAYDLCRDAFETTHVTLVDPLNGYYGGGASDPLVGLPVSPEILARNLRAAGAADEDWTAIQRVSEDPQARAEAARRIYDVLYVDGDHRLEAVRADFHAYGGLVRPGGYIVFDDYGTPEWPAVQAFVDDEASRNPRLEFVGADWQTAVFRVKGP